jgi:hypothetical protein
MSKEEGKLQASPNRGRYKIDSISLDLTSGDPCEIWLGGRWVSGAIEHRARAYHIADSPHIGLFRGYYFVAEDGGVCGLCVGMRVRVTV